MKFALVLSCVSLCLIQTSAEPRRNNNGTTFLKMQPRKLADSIEQLKKSSSNPTKLERRQDYGGDHRRQYQLGGYNGLPEPQPVYGPPAVPHPVPVEHDFVPGPPPPAPIFEPHQPEPVPFIHQHQSPNQLLALRPAPLPYHHPGLVSAAPVALPAPLPVAVPAPVAVAPPPPPTIVQTLTKHVPVPVLVPKPVPVPVEKFVHVDRPVPVEVPVPKPYPVAYPVEKFIEVHRPYAVHVAVPVPVPIAVRAHHKPLHYVHRYHHHDW